MKSLKLKYWGFDLLDSFIGLKNSFNGVKKEYHLLGCLSITWLLWPRLLGGNDPQAGYVDQSILGQMILAIIGFLLLLALCWWLLGRFWRGLGLPDMEFMVSQFKRLRTWQQLSFYMGLFALLLLAGVACLAAIC
nr:hypothetical protein [Pedobacter sp. ASV19]